MTRPSRAFRQDLRRELPGWRSEGLVGDEEAGRLAARYRLDDPHLDGPGMMPVYALGALLVFAGVVSLVAWHWEALSRVVKLALVGGSVVGAHLSGDAIRRAGRHPLLGEAVTLLASLLFGAGIALVAQVFQVSGPWYGLFGGFAAGALLAGLLLDSEATLVAAAVAGAGLWGGGRAVDAATPLGSTFVPWMAGAPFVLLGLARRSPALLAVALLGLLAATSTSAAGANWPFPALLLGVVLLAAARLARSAGPAGVFHALGLLAVAATAYVLSFRGTARHFTLAGPLPGPGLGAGPAASVLPALLAAVLVPWALLRGPSAAPAPGTGEASHAPAVGRALLVAVAALVAAVVLGARFRVAWLVAAGATLLVALVAVDRIVAGLSGLRRGAFWSGLALALLLLLGRFLEIERLLWLKGLAFIAAGVAVTWAAVRFERRRSAARGTGGAP